MQIKLLLFKLLLSVVALYMFVSCTDGNVVSSAVHVINFDRINSKSKPIEDWYVCGTFSLSDDALLGPVVDSLINSPDLCESVNNPDTLNPYWYNGYYKPVYNMLDLREVFNQDKSDNKHSIEGKVTYLACDILSDKETNACLYVKKSMKCFQRLNGSLLHRKEIQGMNFYPVHLNKGRNRYTVKTIAKNDDYSLETKVLDSCGVAEIFVNGQSNNILFPLIAPDKPTATLTNRHQDVLDIPVRISIHDVCGRKVCDFLLRKDTSAYSIPGLRNGTSYMCTMTVVGKTVRQPIACADEWDEIYHRFIDMRKNVADDNVHADEIDQILYRLDFLLRHESRGSDWWWQFKLAPLTYQLEHIFANIDEERMVDGNEFNVQFRTYTSPLDGGMQRYLLTTPDKIKKGKRYPLVVVLRPQVLNQHHFFTSPQFTHQWAINIMQSLANTHDFIVMMPEARMYQREDLIPFANAEIKLAIADVSGLYSIDTSRMYLHGICTGGYRALKMATENPGMFAAVGTYTPYYHQRHQSDWCRLHSLEANLHKIAGTPVLLFADPYDKHTDYKVYADLIEDCGNKGVPLTFIQKRNTELLYNAVVVGEETFDFFDGKSKKSRPTQPSRENDSCFAVADLYSSPFVYVYNKSNQTVRYRNLVNAICKDYEEYMCSKLPIVSDADLTDDMLASKNLFLLGDRFDDDRLTDLIKAARRDNPRLDDDVKSYISVHRNPDFDERLFAVYVSLPDAKKYFTYPWIDGVERVMISKE